MAIVRSFASSRDAALEYAERFTSPKHPRFLCEDEARAFIASLGRRNAQGGRLLARLERRDDQGHWHDLPVTATEKPPTPLCGVESGEER